MRLQRYLANAGVAARRKSEELIVQGVVRVNGKVTNQLGVKIDPENDYVTVHGQAVQLDERKYVVLNKPKACITSTFDPQGRRTVMEFVPGLPKSVTPVGRLDFYSEGVLLLTNDGELASQLLSPKNHAEKTYHVKVQGEVTEAAIARLRRGVSLGGSRNSEPAQVNRLRSKSHHDWLVITLTEGKSRQIHRMLESEGLGVLKLQRVAFAGITFHGLRVGDARELTQSEVNQLRDAAGLPRNSESASRGTWQIRREDTDASRRERDKSRTVPTPNPTPRAAPSVAAGSTSRRYAGAKRAHSANRDSVSNRRSHRR